MRGRLLALSLQSSPAHTMRNQRDADGSDKLIIKTIREAPGQLKMIWSPCGEETDDKVEERFIGHVPFFLPHCLGRPVPTALLLERHKRLLASESGEVGPEDQPQRSHHGRA